MTVVRHDARLTADHGIRRRAGSGHGREQGRRQAATGVHRRPRGAGLRPAAGPGPGGHGPRSRRDVERVLLRDRPPRPAGAGAGRLEFGRTGRVCGRREVAGDRLHSGLRGTRGQRHHRRGHQSRGPGAGPLPSAARRADADGE
ncbi:Exonuclease SbcC [Actinacidiphila bryophytorum]|uniref:Exonuclease SbcC n=1 Tax=Actinacidiphila bryophytorum TaxID=1436133 RepID=A0A9W4MKC5_9ACTN|nr:Exonuclease SbcC [Actinacidiphila bryophytorum]